MAQTADQILSDLKNGAYAPVYFLQGDEPFYIDQISNYIEKNALDEAEKGFNQMVLYGKDVDVTQILGKARSFPMMGQRQVIIVKEAQDLGDLKKEEPGKMLEAYVKNPQPSTVLVFCHKHKKLDKRKAVTKALIKHTVFLESKKLYDNQVPQWVEGYIKQKGHRVKEKAKIMLSEYIGNNLERLSNEVDKILINFNEPVEIDEELVQKYVGISKDFNSFELQKAIAIGDILKANRIANYFAANPKSNPIIPTIALLYGFFTKLLIAHSQPDKTERGVASALKINPFFAKEYMVAMNRYPVPKAMSNIKHIHQADLASKGVSASMAEGQILKELIFKLMH